MNQRVDIIGLEFTLARILILVGFLRIIARGEVRVVNWNSFDKLLLAWIVIGSAVYLLQQGNFTATVTRAGVVYDSLGIYWLSRQTIRNWDDIYITIKMFAILAVVTAPLIAAEKVTESSVFSIFGDVAGVFHRGRFRAAGPFAHYIIMGCFWAILLPLFYAKIKCKKQIKLYILGCLAVISNIIFSASSTPLLTLIALMFFWNLYNFRVHGKVIFWCICFNLAVLHLIMKAPVWHLISRINVFSGSTGWHRYFLIDNFINNVSEWFWMGTKSTAHWGHAQQDITNQFVLEGIRGGMVTLVLFTLVTYFAIKIPGKLSLEHVPQEIKWLNWGICVLMLGHFVNFWGISYFGQISTLLFLSFGLVGFSKDKYNELKLEKTAKNSPKKPHLRNLTTTIS